MDNVGASRLSREPSSEETKIVQRLSSAAFRLALRRTTLGETTDP